MSRRYCRSPVASAWSKHKNYEDWKSFSKTITTLAVPAFALLFEIKLSECREMIINCKPWLRFFPVTSNKRFLIILHMGRPPCTYSTYPATVINFSVVLNNKRYTKISTFLLFIQPGKISSIKVSQITKNCKREKINSGKCFWQLLLIWTSSLFVLLMECSFFHCNCSAQKQLKMLENIFEPEEFNLRI